MLGKPVVPINIIEQLKRDEGLRLKPYKDSVGKLTIGIGRNLDDVGISEAEAEVLLHNDVNFAELQLRNALPWTGDLDEVRFAVLLNMTFNMGIAGLKKFGKTLSLIKAGDFGTAANEMMDSVWAKQVGERAHRLAAQLATGNWQ